MIFFLFLAAIVFIMISLFVEDYYGFYVALSLAIFGFTALLLGCYFYGTQILGFDFILW